MPYLVIHIRIIVLTLLFAVPVAGWCQLYKVSRFSEDNGLTSRIVRDVDQDRDGFIWVAGNNGLYKFDGQQFRGYYAVLNDSTGLRDNKINTLLAASDGRIWVATPRGLHVLQQDRVRYVPLTVGQNAAAEHVVDVFEDSDQNIWVSCYGGLYVIPSDTGEVVNLTSRYPDELTDQTPWSVTEDRQGRLWVCRGRNSPLLGTKEDFSLKEVSVQLEGVKNMAALNPFKYLAIGDTMMLVSSGAGLFQARFNETDTLELQPFKDEQGQVTANDFLYNVIVDHHGDIWTATYRNYFKKYTLEGNTLIQQQVLTKNGLQGMTEFARSIFQDSQGNIWIPNSNGLYKLTEARDKITVFPPSHVENCAIESLSVYAVTEDQQGHIWLTTPYELYRFNKQDILDGDCPTDYLHFDQSNFEFARTLHIDSSNRLWVSGKQGISITQLDANGNPGPFMHYTTENGLPHNWCFDVLEIAPHTFFVGNYIRLLQITLPDNDHTKAAFTTYDADESREDALVNSYTLNLAKDHDDAVWVGTFSGLSKMKSAAGAGQFYNYVSSLGSEHQLSNNSIKTLFVDRQKRLWVGTQLGLNLYLEDENRFLPLGQQEGLPSAYVLGIQEDSKGYLHVATTQGIMKGIYNASMQRFVEIEYYTSREGLADNITYRKALYMDSQDRLFAGSAQGLSLIGQSKASPNTSDFPLALTDLQRIEKRKQGFSSVIHLLEQNEIALSHKENSIQVAYAALDYTAPEFNRYRHKFLPVSDDWIYTQSDSELSYYNLAPGTYQLILDGSNSQGIWSEAPIVLTVIISPPFWQSKIALLLYVLFLGAVLWFLYRIRLRKKMQQLQLETKMERALIQEREELRKENTADFHDELGSKVTKISLFLTLAERSLKEHKDPSQWFAKIRENIKDLSGSFRDLLWVIDPQKDSLSDAFLRLKDFGEELFKADEVDFRTRGYGVHQMELLLDPQAKKQVVMIFKEAMNNCAKYAASTQVTFTVRSDGQYATFELRDNGKGFNVQQKSQGRGLQNMVNRAKKIGGDFSITSSEKGTHIILGRIPHSRDEFQREAI